MNDDQKLLALKEIGKRIKEARNNMRYSQPRLAEALGVTRSAVSLWEAGTTDINIIRLMEIADVLGVKVGWMIGEEAAARWYLVTSGRPAKVTPEEWELLKGEGIIPSPLDEDL